MTDDQTTTDQQPASAAPEQTPSIGSIVHYGHHFWTVGIGTIPRAAIVTHVGEDSTVTLTVFDGAPRQTIRYSVPYSETLMPDHWSWPPRV